MRILRPSFRNSGARARRTIDTRCPARVGPRANCPAAAGCENETEGLVEEAIYQGSDVLLRIRAAGHLIKARGPVGAFNAGETVRVGWDAADAVAIPAPDPGSASGTGG